MQQLTAAEIVARGGKGRRGDEFKELLGETLWEILSYDSPDFKKMGENLIKVIDAAQFNQEALAAIDATIQALGETSVHGILEMTKAKE